MPRARSADADPFRPPVTVPESRFAVEAAAGRVPADLRLRGARVLDPFTLAWREADVLVAGRLVAAVLDPADAEAGPPAARTIDLDGGALTPGLIDGHVHLESSLVAPRRYAEAVLPRGVTGAVCDPHEIANVAGVEGVRWLLERAAGSPFDVWFTVSSCVPATGLETSGAALGEAETRELLAHPDAVGLAELMSFPGVVAGEDAQLRKPLLAEAAGGTVEGHAPAVRGRELQAYLAAGVATDHEAGDPEEGLEKLRAGMFLFVREGSVARDARALAPLVVAAHGERIGFCSDDVAPHDLLRDGGVDAAVRAAIDAGAEPAVALRAATWNVARHYRLPRRGAIAPGRLADLVWWRGDPAAMDCGIVWKEGREVARDGRLASATPAPAAAPSDASLRGRVRLPRDLGARLDAALVAAAGGGREVPVIAARPDSLLTGAERAAPPLRDGRLAADPARDLALLACAERHGRNGNLAAAAVRGFGLRRGAIATSVGHDHHNLMAVGADAGEILAALRRIEATGGGMVVVDRGAVRAELPLPLGGLLADAPLAEVRDALDRLDAAARDLGCRLPAPHMALSFLGLAVVPDLKLTDRGLVDVRAGRLLDGTAPA